MTNFFTLRKSFLLGLLLAASSLCSMADEGHDHGDAPTVAAVPAKPRFTATSEAFELVGVVNGKTITLYLDHAADNSPVMDQPCHTLEQEARLGQRVTATTGRSDLQSRAWRGCGGCPRR